MVFNYVIMTFFLAPSQELLTFVTTLSAMNTNNYQLQLLEPSTVFLRKIMEHSSYAAWSDFHPKSRNILYIFGPHDDANARYASTLFFRFQESAEKQAIATYTFSERDVRTQSISTFYASLCRQLLLYDSLSYPRVSSILETIPTEQAFSHKTIRNLLLSIIRASMPRSVVIIIHGVQNCSSLLVEDLLLPVDEFRRPATSALKIIILGGKVRNENLLKYPHSCCIDLDKWNDYMPLVEAFAQEETNLVVKNNLQLRYHRDTIFRILFSRPCDFNRIAFTAKLMMLESEGIPSTKRAAADTLNGLPTWPYEIYPTILERCRSKCGLPLDSLWMWICHSVRPLTLGELAVATAISSSQHMNLQDLELEIPNQISCDLKYLNGTLIKISDLQVLPIFPSFGRTTEEVENENNFTIFGKCMDYLKAALDFVKLQKGEAKELHKIFNGPKYEFVEYAVVEWPQHYKRTNKGSKRGLVKEVFNDEDSIKSWFSLYKLYTGSSADEFSKLDSILKIACWFGFGDLTEHMIQELSKKDGCEMELSESLDMAAARGREDAVVLLLNAGARSKNAMSLAANGGFMDIIQKLHEADPNMIHDAEIYGRPPLMMAILNGDEKISSYLLEHGAKCDIMMQNGTMPLHLAAGIGHVEIVNLLLEKNVDIHALSAKGSNALHLAAARGFDDISKILINSGVRINQKNNDGMTALHLAAKHGQSSTIDILLDAGAEVDTITSDGYSPIHLAAKEGFWFALRKLIRRQRRQLLEKSPKEPTSPSSTNEASETAQKSEAKESDNVVAIDEGESSSQKRHSEKEGIQRNHLSDWAVPYSPLQLAAQNGHGENVGELLQHEEYSSDRDRAISLLLAAKEGFDKIVEMLLQSTIMMHLHDKDGNTALRLAVDGAYTDIVEQLVSFNSDNSAMFDIRATNLMGWTPLHFAARSGRLVALQILLDNGAEMRDRDKSDQTAFHVAASHGHISILRELLNRPYSGHKVRDLISAPDRAGDTPFILAVRSGHLGVTKYILDTVPLDGRRLSFYQGRNKALVEAVKLRHFNLIELLSGHGWDINKSKSATALHYAVKVQDHELIDFLLGLGADPNVLDSKSQSSIHIAAQSYPKALQTLLKDRDGVQIDIDLQGELGRTAIWQASWVGNETAVEQLLKLSPDLEVKSSAGLTALHATCGKPYLTKLLLDAGANPMALSDDHTTPFMLAAYEESGHMVIEHYINNDAECDFNVQDQQGKTALHIAAMGGTLDTVKLLRSSIGSITATTNEGATALHYAAHAGQLDIIEYLIKQGLDIDSNSNSMGTPLMSAAAENRVDAAKVLLKNGAKVDLTNEEYYYHSALQTAAAKGAEYMVQMLLEAGANPNIVGGAYGSPLCAAVRVGNLAIASRLLEAGADINHSKGQKGTALEYAINCHSFHLINLLLEHKADVNIASNGKKHGTPLIAAIHRGSFYNVKILLEHGADANLSSSRGEKPIQAALCLGSKDIFNILLEKGVQLAFKDQWGRGPLSTAIVSKSRKLLPHLLGHEDVDINERDSVGRTPLILSVLHCVGMIGELQNHGADIDAQDDWGRTALIYAIVENYYFVVSELVKSGAALGLKDVRGRDALYWASKRPNIFYQVLESMRHRESYSESLQHAINATIALNEPALAEQLLEVVDLNPLQTDDNGWTIYDTAARNKNEAIIDLIDMAVARQRQTPLEKSLNSVKIPTQWHPLDLSPALTVSSNGTSLTVSEDCM